jgi:capsule polysaccharide export protein KpsE/RkpR
LDFGLAHGASNAFEFQLEGDGSVTQTAAKPQREIVIEHELPESLDPIEDPRVVRERAVARLRLVWSRRRFLFRVAVSALIVSTLVAFLIPKRYDSTTQLMPPDSQSSSNLTLMAGLAGQTGGLTTIAGDLLGIKTTGALFVGVLRSRTAQDRIVERFDLKKVYGVRLEEKARLQLAQNTGISEDRKSGIITVTVSDHDPKRAAAIAAAYVDELDALMAQLSTSSARRERIFLEGRLDAVNQELEASEKDFSQFASKNATIDITEQGKAMVIGAATLEGELIAAQSELEGLRQIYSDGNVRVRSTQARVNELRQQLARLGGKAGTSADDGETESGAVYPTIRQLPLLGVPYADKFRKWKVEEAVYSTLTKEYELAKVEEAKEIPTVKVLDAAEVPELGSFPPRQWIMVLGTIFALIGGVVWVLQTARWRDIDPQDPAKLFVEEVFQTVNGRMPWAASNGSRVEGFAEGNGDRPGTEGNKSGG